MTTRRTTKAVKGPSIARNIGRLSTLRGHIKKPTSGRAYPYKHKRY